jgi:hypothetical protein
VSNITEGIKEKLERTTIILRNEAVVTTIFSGLPKY